MLIVLIDIRSIEPVHPLGDQEGMLNQNGFGVFLSIACAFLLVLLLYIKPERLKQEDSHLFELLMDDVNPSEAHLSVFFVRFQL